MRRRRKMIVNLRTLVGKKLFKQALNIHTVHCVCVLCSGYTWYDQSGHLLYTSISVSQKSITLYRAMPEKQQALRRRAVQFFEKHKDNTLKITVEHFTSESIPRSTVYNILHVYKQRGNINHKNCGIRQSKIMTKRRISWP